MRRQRPHDSREQGEAAFQIGSRQVETTIRYYKPDPRGHLDPGYASDPAEDLEVRVERIGKHRRHTSNEDWFLPWDHKLTKFCREIADVLIEELEQHPSVRPAILPVDFSLISRDSAPC